MIEKNVMETVQSFGLKKVLTFLDSAPEKNLPRILDWLIKLDRENKYVAPQAQLVKDVITDPDNNWNILLKSLWTDIDNEVRKRLFENFIINASVLGGRRQEKVRETYQCNVPWAILVDPTSACNLHCLGCWAADYGSRLNMSFQTLDDIIQQGKKLGVFFYLFSGGEPLMRKQDVIHLCQKHSDCAFLAFTNGTLIDEAFATDMLRVKNFVPAISVEGFQADTDSRRGSGTFQAVVRAMRILKDKKLPFGISCCYTSNNTQTIGGEAFIDAMIEYGAKFAWFFTYIPVGNNAVTHLMASAEQRKYMYRQLRAFRSTKPIFTMDFWNDGEYSQGCIAGGRRYLHINANGDIEPCAFIHYSDTNVAHDSLLDALQSPLFMQYRNNQPFNNNHLRPCPLLDNNKRLAEMVASTEAVSTDLQNPEDVWALCSKCKSASDKWEPVADQLWAES